MTELQPSKLGTKEHWDNIYEEELENFKELGEEGEIWFGAGSIDRVVGWAMENVPPSINPFTLEIGSGNGTLLFALVEAGYAANHLSGIDYSPGAVKLARSIAAIRGHDIAFSVCNFLQDKPPSLSYQEGTMENVWDLLLDKGTFDAIALAPKDGNGKSPAIKYPERVESLLKPGGYFLITSCNFTEKELKDYFTTSTGLIYHSRIQYPVFQFGGKEGCVCSSVAFQKL